MAEETGISWTHHTFNPWWGCAKVSPACDHCYAERDAHRFAPTATLWGVDAGRREFGDKHWNAPLGWNAKAAAAGERRRVFCASMADVFDKNAPDGARDRLWALIEATPHLDWLLLTKRIGNAKRMLPARWLEPGGWPKNARLGISIVNQEETDRDLEKLLELDCPNFVSMEPLLGPVDLTRYSDWLGSSIGGMWCPDCPERGVGIDPDEHTHCHGEVEDVAPYHGIDWVIVGGESGPGARPMHPDWVRSLRDQCEAADVPFHFKQWGEWAPDDHFTTLPGRDADIHEWGDGEKIISRSWRYGKKASGRLLDGVEHNGFPA